ncbi:hypothetical protein BSKO_00117 [Bryopsis sp. KO-2023]|nr:hypothetical protein BSKO_00117 [Bryopsis sp. KO-2023]
MDCQLVLTILVLVFLCGIHGDDSRAGVLRNIALLDSTAYINDGRLTKTASVTECSALCDATPGCQAWTRVKTDLGNTKAGECRLLGKPVPTRTHPAFDSGIKSLANQDTCGPVFRKWDLPGEGVLNDGHKDITNDDAACCKMCRDRQDCKSWVRITRDNDATANKKGECWLRHKINAGKACDFCDSGADELGGCNVQYSMDYPDGDVINNGHKDITNSNADCCKLCRNTKECVVWTRIKMNHDETYNKEGECWMRRNIPAKKPCSFCDSGFVEKESPPAASPPTPRKPKTGPSWIGSGMMRVGGYLGASMSPKGFPFKFVDNNCRRFYFSGWNSWEIIEAAYGTASALPKASRTPEKGKDLVRWIFDTAQKAGLSWVRFFGHGWDEKGMVLQPSPGKYNEEAMKALDWVIAEAGRRKLQLVMTFADNWKEGDSRKTYAKWAGKEPMDFYTDDSIKTMYKNHIKYVVNRKNTDNGIVYKDDPTIFAWDIMNEPRCDCNIAEGGPHCDIQCAKNLDAFLHEMAAFLKREDPNHMVTIGEEGFYSELTSDRLWINPDAYADGGSPWAATAGQSFINNHDGDVIDYLGIHAWPDNWGLPERWFQKSWIQNHMEDSHTLSKPFIVEEFGKTVYTDKDIDRRTLRDPFLKEVYEFFAENRVDGPIQGIAFWEYDAAEGAGKTPGPYGIRPTHSSWKDVITPFSSVVNDELKNLPLMEHCVPGESRSYDSVFLAEVEKGGFSAEVTDGEEIYFTTHGRSTVSNQIGSEVGQPKSGPKDFKECMSICTKTKDCESFRYKPGNPATCTFHKVSGKDLVWDMDGWQLFHKKSASTSCASTVKDCRYCDENGVCIKCMRGDLIWDYGTDSPGCPAAGEATADNSYLDEFEFGLPKRIITPQPEWKIPEHVLRNQPFLPTYGCSSALDHLVHI